MCVCVCVVCVCVCGYVLHIHTHIHTHTHTHTHTHYVCIHVCMYIIYREVSVFEDQLCQGCCSSGGALLQLCCSFFAAFLQLWRSSVAALLQLQSLTSKVSHSEFLFSFSNILRFSPYRPPAHALSRPMYRSLWTR
jgi:hypothetical protein